MDQLINLIPHLLGVDVEAFYAFLVVLVTVCNLLGRWIPDSATGTLGVIRKACKVVGLYVGNRISPNINTNDVARAVVATVPDEKILESAETLQDAVAIGAPIGQAAGTATDAILDSLAGRRPSERPAGVPDGSRVPDQFRTDGPFQRQKDR